MAALTNPETAASATAAPHPSLPAAFDCGGWGLAPPNQITVSVFSANEAIGKRRGLNTDGSLRKVAGAPRPQSVRQVSFDTIEAFAQYALKAPTSEAFAFGLCALPEARVAVADSDKREDVVARTKQFFSFAGAPGVLLLDHDPLPGEQPLAPAELVDLLRAAVPELRNVALAAKPSSSAHLHASDGTELVGAAGVHVFVPVHDATRVPEFGAIIAERLWLVGRGRVKTTANGNRLYSTPIDASVWSPERLVFTRAACEDGVDQRLGEIGYFPGQYDDLVGEGWLNDLAPLTDNERTCVAELKALAHAEAEPAARVAREKWAEQRLEERARLASDRGEAINRDAVRASLLCGEQVLPAELVLYPVGAEPITAREMFDAGSKWNGARLADPFEPSYCGDSRIALAVFDCDEPHIFSHAHGGQRYLFRSEEARQAEIAADFEDLGPPPEPERKRHKFEGVPAGDFIRGPAPCWLIKGVLPQAGLGVIFGEPGSGKTFLLIDLVASVALGTPWRGLKVKQQRVLYVCAEGAGGFRNRVGAYIRQFDVEFGDNLRVVDRPPSLLDKGDAAALIEGVRISGAGLVIVDTLSQALAGGDENSSTDMGAALKVCRDLHISTGAMVLLVHHSGKDASRGARGWSGLKAAADVEIEVTRGPGARVARISKLKDAEDGGTFGFKLVPICIGVDEDGEEISSCYVDACDAIEAAPARRFGTKQRAVLDALHDLTPISGDAVSTEQVLARAIDALPVDPEKRDRRREHVRRALNELIEQGVITEDEGALRTSGAESE